MPPKIYIGNPLKAVDFLRYTGLMATIRALAQKAATASRHLALLSMVAKNEILEKIADMLQENIPLILRANEKDMKAGRKNGLSEGLLDRLLLTESRLEGIISEVRKVASLPDPIGTILESKEMKNGLFIRRVRVPLGVIGMIYEARPNVTVDAAVLCFKSGNSVILKGGSDALNSNVALVKIIQEVLKEVGGLAPRAGLADAVQLIATTDRNATKELLTMRDLVDVIIPRGSKNLIDFVRANATVPVIETGASVVHTYVHDDADMTKAVKIILNAKLRRVSTCNTLDTLLVHKNITQKLLTALIKAFAEKPYQAPQLEIRADGASYAVIKKLLATDDKISGNTQGTPLTLKKATATDYTTEFLDYILAIKVVNDLDGALSHIAEHSLKHSEAIVTENGATAQRFLNEVDAACVYWNTSTQFSDGGQFGLGAEIGISTQKLHVRGPFALEGLTSYKWIIEGNGNIRVP